MDLFFENCSSSPDGLRSELILPTWVQQVVAMWIACSPYRHSRINVHLSWSASLKCMYEQLAVAFALACAAKAPDNNMAGNTVRHTATAGRRNRGLGTDMSCLEGFSSDRFHGGCWGASGWRGDDGGGARLGRRWRRRILFAEGRAPRNSGLAHGCLQMAI
jgi:hypothetical protein